MLTGQDEQASDGAAAGAVLAVTDGLNAHDFEVLDPAFEGCHYLKVTNARNALSEIMISDKGHAS